MKIKCGNTEFEMTPEEFNKIDLSKIPSFLGETAKERLDKYCELLKHGVRLEDINTEHDIEFVKKLEEAQNKLKMSCYRMCRQHNN